LCFPHAAAPQKFLDLQAGLSATWKPQSYSTKQQHLIIGFSHWTMLVAPNGPCSLSCIHIVGLAFAVSLCRLDKARENAAALEVLPDLLREVDALPPADRLASLVQGVRRGRTGSLPQSCPSTVSLAWTPHSHRTGLPPCNVHKGTHHSADGPAWQSSRASVMPGPVCCGDFPCSGARLISLAIQEIVCSRCLSLLRTCGFGPVSTLCHVPVQVLAANIFDWGAKATVQLYHNGTILEIYRSCDPTSQLCSALYGCAWQ
jgi:hypothetical protein